MPIHIDDIAAEVAPEPGDGAHPGGDDAGGAGGGGEQAGPWFCARLQQERIAHERRERLVVD